MAIGCNPEGFFRETLSRVSRPLGAIPMLGVDECLNRRDIEPALSQWVASGTVSQVVPLWYQRRSGPSGEMFVTQGSVPPGEGSELYPSQPIKHTAWTDEDVMCFLLAHFVSHDRIAFITENTRNDVGGIRRLLSAVVAPIMEQHHRGRFSLLACFKKPATTYALFMEGVEQQLEMGSFEPGFRLELL
ncbi:MAG: hypothetical protein IPJ78_19430 [Gemmatimonadetes bacterium]|nr:hypothetical protein [Gemmatimonadota bacterium]